MYLSLSSEFFLRKTFDIGIIIHNVKFSLTGFCDDLDLLCYNVCVCVLYHFYVPVIKSGFVLFACNSYITLITLQVEARCFNHTTASNVTVSMSLITFDIAIIGNYIMILLGALCYN